LYSSKTSPVHHPYPFHLIRNYITCAVDTDVPKTLEICQSSSIFCNGFSEDLSNQYKCRSPSKSICQSKQKHG